MRKNILIIGFGSIGKRHANILKKFKNISNIYILTKQICKNFKKIENIKQIKKIDPDYIIIATKTSDHFKYLLFLEKNFSNKTILVEKPLFEKYKKLKIKNNKIFVGYNLRYHPVLVFIKNFIKNKKIFSIDVNCHSYLPHWRKSRNYSKTNSAKKVYGGGALLELSHEIDYLEWIFNKINKLKYVSIGKFSNLNIDCEDHVLIAGQIFKAEFFMSLNFYSLKTKRDIIINGNGFCLEGNLIDNKIIIFQNGKKLFKKFKVDKNLTYRIQHRNLINGKFKNSCSFNQGLELMKTLDTIRANG